MEIFNNLMHGFSIAFALDNLMWAAFGVFMGNLIGVLPGMGVLAAISILLPLTYTMTPTAALVMLSGIYYGSQYGGGITSIMLNLPGTASHAVACLDGNPLARNGKAGSALFMLMFSPFFGASIGILAMILFSPLLVDVAFKFGPAEYFSMMMLGLLAGATLAKGSAIKGVAMVVVGLLLGVVGTDVNTGVMRFHFGVLELSDGLQIVALAMGLFGVADFLKNINRLGGDAKVTAAKISMKSMRPEAGDIKQSRGALVRHGHRRGLRHPARHRADHRVLHLVCHREEGRARPAPLRPWRHRGHCRARSHQRVHADRLHPDHEPGHPWRSGHGADAGRAHHPRHPARTADDGRACRYVLGLIASFWVGNILLLLLNLPLIGMWVRLLTVPFRYLFPAALFFVCVGVYSTNNNLFDVGMVTLFGVAGYALMRLRFEPAPLLLGFVLGPMVEENFRRALLLRAASCRSS